MTHYRFVPERSRARVLARAPGHTFAATGAGIEGSVVVEGEHVTSASARFPLANLRAGDPLGNRELAKFLDFKSAPVATAELLGPLLLPHGSAQIRFEIGHRRMETMLRADGRPPAGKAQFGLTFSGLGYSPPRLLFFKVAEDLTIEIEAEITPVDV